jgi:hypothetical protein
VIRLVEHGEGDAGPTPEPSRQISEHLGRDAFLGGQHFGDRAEERLDAAPSARDAAKSSGVRLVRQAAELGVEEPTRSSRKSASMPGRAVSSCPTCSGRTRKCVSSTAVAMVGKVMVQISD